MEEIDYKLINDYFNNISLRMFKDKDIEDNFLSIIRLNDKYNKFIGDRLLKNKTYYKHLDEVKMSYIDVINITKEIINTINPKYTEIIDNLLSNGKLDFAYEDGIYHDSYVIYNRHTKNKLININRTFTFNDVVILIHEFMHYVTSISTSFNDYIITEFISIYFELYANIYLLNNYNPSLSSIYYEERLLSSYKRSDSIYGIEFPFIAYINFGNLNENSYNLVNQYILPYTKKNYEFECNKVIRLIEKENNEKNKYIQSSQFSLIERNIYYFLATIMAFYVRGKYDMKDVINLAENVSNDEKYDLSLFEIFKKYNLKIEDDIFNITFDEIEKYLSLFENKKQRVN